MTAVIYARYSSDNQREESIEGQIRECTAYAEKNGITIVKHYIDRAISAKTDNRPEFQQMIKDSDKKLFDIVLVWKLDRFARNRYDSARYKTQLKKNGVKLMSATEIISEGPEGIILESVLEGYAEYYSADLAEKVVRGQTENILKGRCNGGRGTFGYTLDSERKFHIDPLASPFVLESFRKYRDGLTMKEIRDWLNENGIKNPVGGAFTYNSVEHMLKNRRYIGELKFRDVVVPDAIPPIVPLELFEDVQEKIAKNKKAPARRKAEDDYLLTTKLHCGYCGALMFGESGTSRTGEVHRYYKCATAKKHKGCKKKTVRKQWLEDLVVNQTMQLVRDDVAMESIIAKVMELQDRESTNLPLYEKQLRDAESGIQNMLNAIQAGILTSSTKERLEQLEETKRELEARIAEEKLAKPKIKEEFIRFWLMRFRKLDMSLKDQRQALVDTFINSIYLYDDKVLITFNYKEGTQTITFEEAAQAASKGNGSDLDCFTAPRKTSTHCVLVFLFCLRDGRGSNRAAAHSAASNQPSGLLLSPRVPTRRNVYRGSCKSKDFMAFLFFWQSLHTFAHLLHTLQKSHEIFASLAQRVFRCTKIKLVGARPLHLAYARPLCCLKAPLGLSLLRKRKFLREEHPRQLAAFLCVHLPDGFKDHFICDFCCPRCFVFRGFLRLRTCHILRVEVGFNLLCQLQPGACPACGRRAVRPRLPRRSGRTASVSGTSWGASLKGTGSKRFHALCPCCLPKGIRILPLLPVRPHHANRRSSFSSRSCNPSQYFRTLFTTTHWDMRI